MVVFYLLAMCLISFANACILSFVYRCQINNYFTAVFYCAAVANFGFLSLALSTTLEGALFSNRLCYLGSCFVPLFLFFGIVRICKFDFPRWANVLLVLFCAFVFALSSTMGISDIYYKSVKFVMINGVGGYEAEYGPAHVLWNVFLSVFVVANIAAIFYAVKVKRNVSFKNLMALAILEFLTVVLFVITREMGTDTLVIPLIYVLDELFLFYVCLQFKMYDISNNVITAIEAENVCAFVAASPAGLYLGCNDIALRYFPELRKYRVDHIMPMDGKLAAAMYGWLKDLKRNKIAKSYQFEYGDKCFKATYKHVSAGNNSKIRLFRIEDETKIRRYIESLDANTSELEDVIRNNANHIKSIQKQMIVGMAKMVESRDNATGGHIKRTSEIVAILSEEMKQDTSLVYSKKFFEALVAAAPMHDLGKIAIDDQILRKTGKFTSEEFEAMKTHAEKGYAIVENLLSEIESPFFIEIAKNVVRSHHERWDGSGYPQGLAGNQIPFEARVMAIADVYDALVRHRGYREQMTLDQAFNEIVNSMGYSFDPSLKKYFVASRQNIENYYRSVEY